MRSLGSRSGVLVAGVALSIASAAAVAALVGGTPKASASGAASVFTATLTGAQETPPNASPATGSATVVLDASQTTITADVTFSGLTANATAAHIHTAPAGTPGPVTFPFSGVPIAPGGCISEQSFLITPAQVADLQAGNMYVNVHSSTFPGGEVRGQLALAPSGTTAYTAALDGSQEVPPTGSAGTGAATVLLSADQMTLTVDLSWSGLTSSATGAHVHNAAPGVSGPIIFPLTGVPAAQAGCVPEQSFAITPAQVTELQGGRFYLNVHSEQFSGGEIRGQLAVTPTAVRVTDASATRTARGVLVRWRTASEAQSLGFNLYRAERGRLMKLNRTLIRSAFAGTAAGRPYSWLDRAAPRGSVIYRLQSVSLDGTKSWVGSTAARRR